MIAKLHRDELRGQLASIEAILGKIPETEYANRASFEGRRDEIQAELADIERGTPEVWARVGLFFGGTPVIGTLGIDAEFASEAVGRYQSIVSLLAAAQGREAPLASTGRIPDREESRLHITGILHGSFGFELNELESNAQAEPLFNKTPLALNVEKTTQIITSAGVSDEAFSDAISDVDERVVASVRDFFKLLKRRHATFRVVVGELDHSFDHGAIELASERTDVVLTTENDVPLSGQFLGAYPANASEIVST